MSIVQLSAFPFNFFLVVVKKKVKRNIFVLNFEKDLLRFHIIYRIQKGSHLFSKPGLKAQQQSTLFFQSFTLTLGFNGTDF